MIESRRFVSDVMITFIASLVNIIISFPISVVIGRYLGVEDLGAYRLVFSIYGLSLLFANAGIPAAVIKQISEIKEDPKSTVKVISSSFFTSSLLGIFFLIFYLLFAETLSNIFGTPELADLIRIISLSFPFSVTGSTMLATLNGFRDMKKHATAILIQSVLMLFFTILSITFGYGVNGAVGASVISSIGYCVYLLRYLGKYIKIINFSDAVHYSKSMITFGLQTVVANAVNLINFQADTIMVGYFLTKTDVGFYSVAVLLAKLLWLIPDSIQKITYPLISEHYNNSGTEYINRAIETIMKYTMCISIVIGSGMIFYGEGIITSIYGASFIESVNPYYILIVGTMIFSIVKCVNSLFASIGRVDLFAKIPTYSAAVNILLNLVLIPIYHINGAAIATSTSLLIYVLVMIYYMKKLVNIHINVIWYSKAIFLFAMLIIINYILSLFTPFNSSGILTVSLGCLLLWIYILEPSDRVFFLSLVTKLKSLSLN